MGGPWSAGQPARIQLVIAGINAPHQWTRWLEGSSHPTDNSPISYPKRQVWAGSVQGLPRFSEGGPLSLNPPMGFPGGRSGVVWGWWAGRFRWCLGGFGGVVDVV